MKTTAVLALIFAAAYVAPAFAQGNAAVQAEIPFSFDVNGSTLPAGSYVIHTSGSSHVLSILDRAHGTSILTLGSPGDPIGVKDNVLVFHRYGNQYFLSEIRTQGSSMNYAFPTSKAEKAARNMTEEAKLPTNAPVLVALR